MDPKTTDENESAADVTGSAAGSSDTAPNDTAPIGTVSSDDTATGLTASDTVPDDMAGEEDEESSVQPRIGTMWTTPALAVAGLVVTVLSVTYTGVEQMLLFVIGPRFISPDGDTTATAAVFAGSHALLALVGGGLGLSALWIGEDGPRWVDAVARAAVIVATIFLVIFLLLFLTSVLLPAPQPQQVGG